MIDALIIVVETLAGLCESISTNLVGTMTASALTDVVLVLLAMRRAS